MLFPLARLEKATILFGLVGLMTTELSVSLPDVALTFTTGVTQASGWNSLLSSGTWVLGFMHLRVPSGTYLFWFGDSSWACRVDVAGAINAKTHASMVRRRRVFILYAGILLRRPLGGWKRARKRRDS